MLTPKTPGVYIQEIVSLPASIAPVATAVPAFVGYTEQAVLNGETLANNTPVRIQSLLEYREIFGVAFDELFEVTIADPTAPATEPGIVITTPATAPAPAKVDDLSLYLLYYQLKMFYANGGGPCYVISVGTYDDGTISNTALEEGVAAIEKEDEPTIIVVPEAVHLTPALRKAIYDAMLAQCAKLQDRVAVMDVLTDGTQSIVDDSDDFRNDTVGPDDLKYGMAYYPSLKTSLERYYTEGSVQITDNRTAPVFDLDECTLNVLNDGGDFAIAKIIIDDSDIIDGDTITVGTKNFVEGTDFDKGAGAATTAKALAEAIEAHADPAYSVSRASNVIILQAADPGTPAPAIPVSYADSGALGVAVTIFSAGGLNFVRVPADTTLYARIKKEIKKLTPLSLYPCGAMAGVYARVDRDRGVWKAPANVSLRNVREPARMITSLEQENLNIDATSGKSINAIRTFSGKGVMVWGARTLAGNDNEWRYVPVRRFYNFAEESIKKATEFVVFEPNDAKTWVRVKGMIENFLTNLWREGALAGAKPENAFFVKVGLGETMTAQDILEGIMNVEIGMAVVRPAEFIILKFSHKLQES